MAASLELLALEPSALDALRMLCGLCRGEDLPRGLYVRAYIIIRLRDKILRKKILRFCQAYESKKKLEIDYRNLEFSDQSIYDSKSRDIRFLRNVNLDI
jgi:predicted neuraminidase